MAYQLLAVALLQAVAVSADGLAKLGGALNARQAGNPAACESVQAIYDSCASKVPGFSAEPDAQAASCLCYSGSTWQPGVLDGYILGCANYIKTAEPSSYSAYAQLEDYCTDLGNVAASPTGAPSSIVASATTSFSAASVPLTTPVITSAPATTALKDAPGCSQWYNSYLSCSSATPGFTDFNDEQAASCLCYVGTSFAPSVLDGEATTCANFVKTADPSVYPSWTAVAQLCTSVGDVRASASASATSAAAASTSTGGLFNTPTSQTTTSKASKTSSTSSKSTSTSKSQGAQVTVTATPSGSWAPGASFAVLQEGLMRSLYIGFVLVVGGLMVVL